MIEFESHGSFIARVHLMEKKNLLLPHTVVLWTCDVLSSLWKCLPYCFPGAGVGRGRREEMSYQIAVAKTAKGGGFHAMREEGVG